MIRVSSKVLALGAGIAAAGVTAVGAVTYGTTGYLMKIAMDRKLPSIPYMDRAKKMLSGGMPDVHQLQDMAIAAQKLEATPHTVVMIEAHDGQQLVGHWFPNKRAKRVIVAMHGWRSGWSSDFGIVADFWNHNECSVLYCEQRGQGNSGGEYMGFGLIERHDCLSWCHWVNSYVQNQMPLYLVGVSMGATTVLMASDLDLPQNVCGIIADCGFTSPKDIWKYVAEHNLHLSYRIYGNAADRFCRRKLQVDSGSCNTMKCLKNAKAPVLLIHGTEDRFVPVEMTYQNYRACTSPKQLLIVPGAGHGMSYFVEQNRYQQAVKSFFIACEDTKKEILP